MGRMKEVPYVWQVAAVGGIVAVACRGCQHRGFVAAASLPERLHKTALHALRLSCSE